MNDQEQPLFQPLPNEDADIVPKKTLPSRNELIHFFQNYTPSRAHSLKKSTKHSASANEDPHPTAKDSGKYCEVQPHVYRFNFVLFLKVFLIQVLLYFFGPVIMVLNLCCKRPLIHNVICLSPTRFGKWAFYFLMPILNWYVIWRQQEDRMQILSVLQSMIFVFLAMSFHAAQINDEIAKRLTTTCFEKEDLSRYRFFSTIQVDNNEEFRVQKRIIREVSSRLNIDLSLLRYKYLQHINAYKDVKAVDDHLALANNMSEYETTQFNIFRTAEIADSDFLTEYNKFEEDMSKLKYLTVKTRVDDQPAYFHPRYFAFFIDEEGLSDVAFLPITLFFLFYPLVALVYDAIMTSARWWGLTGWYFVSLIPVLCIGIILFDGLEKLFITGNLMKKLSEKLTVERPKSQLDEKLTESFDIFDYMTLKSWISLRKIAINAYNRELSTVTWSISVIMTFQAIGAIFIVFTKLGIFHFIKFEDYIPYYIAFGIECSVYLIVLLVFTLKSAALNGYFSKHRTLLRANKEVVTTIFRLYPSLVGENPMLPSTYIHNEAFKRLYREFGNDYSQEEMNARFNMLMATFDSMIEELDYEEKYNPFKLLGFAVTPNVVKGQITALVSLGIAFVPNLISILKGSLSGST